MFYLWHGHVAKAKAIRRGGLQTLHLRPSSIAHNTDSNGFSLDLGADHILGKLAFLRSIHRLASQRRSLHGDRRLPMGSLRRTETMRIPKFNFKWIYWAFLAFGIVTTFVMMWTIFFSPWGWLWLLPMSIMMVLLWVLIFIIIFFLKKIQVHFKWAQNSPQD